MTNVTKLVKGSTNGINHEKNGNKRPLAEERWIYWFVILFFFKISQLFYTWQQKKRQASQIVNSV